MAASNATLHMMCGKIAAGKSTLSAKLGEAENRIVISEDRWIAGSLDYIRRRSNR
jgi:predicted kinase